MSKLGGMKVGKIVERITTGVYRKEFDTVIDEAKAEVKAEE